MTDLQHRSTETELMDGQDTSPEDYARALADLATVNRVTFTHRPVIGFLRAATSDWPHGAVLSVLDVASGQGDLLRAIHRWGTKRGFVLQLAGVDLNPASTMEATAATPAEMDIAWHIANVFDYTPHPRPHFIVSSQFCHHLDDPGVVAFLQWLHRTATRGWFITDLHRHWLPYYGFRLLAYAMFWHRIVRIDGTISIARGFTARGWHRLLAQAGMSAEIRWHMMFRHGIGWLR